MKRIVVAGATGYLGTHLVRYLKAQGFWVRALARPGKEVEAADEVFHAEATKPDTLVGLCDGIDTVFSSLGITRQTDKVTYMDVDYGANSNVLEEALAAGVERFALVSIVNAGLLPNHPMVLARETFVAELQKAEIQSSVIRATGFFCDLAEVFAMAKSGAVYLFDEGHHRSNPIHGEDLARVMLEAVLHGVEEVTAGGPDVLTAKEVADLAFEALGKKSKIRVIPPWVVATALALVKPFNRRLYDVGTFMRVGFTHDMVGTPGGRHHLSDFYMQLARDGA